MDEVLKFIGNHAVFYLATVDEDKPRVRPFGLAIPHEGKIYFTTGNKKDVYRQMIANPLVELCTMGPEEQWIRVRGKAVFDKNMEVKKTAFAQAPFLANIYQSPENPEFEVFYLTDAEAAIYSMTAPPQIFKF